MPDHIATLTTTRIPKERRMLENEKLTSAEHGGSQEAARTVSVVRQLLPELAFRVSHLAAHAGRSEGSGLDRGQSNHQGNTSTERATVLQAAAPGRGMCASVSHAAFDLWLAVGSSIEGHQKHVVNLSGEEHACCGSPLHVRNL